MGCEADGSCGKDFQRFIGSSCCEGFFLGPFLNIQAFQVSIRLRCINVTSLEWQKRNDFDVDNILKVFFVRAKVT